MWHSQKHAGNQLWSNSSYESANGTSVMLYILPKILMNLEEKYFHNHKMVWYICQCGKLMSKSVKLKWIPVAMKD